MPVCMREVSVCVSPLLTTEFTRDWVSWYTKRLRGEERCVRSGGRQKCYADTSGTTLVAEMMC